VDKHSIQVNVNGVDHSVMVEPRLLLSDFLRKDLGLTGTHVGCEHGVCGACTVLVNGQSVRSCLTFTVQVDDAIVETVESLVPSPGKELHPLQEAFRSCHGLQCGFCTPGILMMATELMNSGAIPSREEIREHMSGNLCRCTGYETILDAIQVALSPSNIIAREELS
jgi:carbon-monoxide dehydrogenase small subunit